MTLQDDLNKVLVAGHRGPHPQSYHDLVYAKLQTATRGLSGDEYKIALQNELKKIGNEVVTPGTVLNSLVTKK